LIFQIIVGFGISNILELKNCQFQSFEFFWNETIANIGYFKNLKELKVFMKELIKKPTILVNYLMFSSF
jgi:hypothetical protein